MKLFRVDDEHAGRVWFFRIAPLVAIIAVIAAIGVFFRAGNAPVAIVLLVTACALAVVLAWSWTGFLFASLERAKHYVDGAEGAHRHEWYSFKGQRVRVVLDDMQRPWFAANEIAFILGIEDEKHTFRHYGPHEYGIPESASEHYVSEAGLRHLIKYSTHPDAGALGIWLEREVLRMLRNRKKRRETGGLTPDE